MLRLCLVVLTLGAAMLFPSNASATFSVSISISGAPGGPYSDSASGGSPLVYTNPNVGTTSDVFISANSTFTSPSTLTSTAFVSNNNSNTPITVTIDFKYSGLTPVSAGQVNLFSTLSAASPAANLSSFVSTFTNGSITQSTTALANEASGQASTGLFSQDGSTYSLDSTVTFVIAPLAYADANFTTTLLATPAPSTVLMILSTLPIFSFFAYRSRLAKNSMTPSIV